MDAAVDAAVETTPFDTVSWSWGRSTSCDASWSSACRASAAAVRIAGPPRAMDALEYVPPWLGVTLVSRRIGVDLAHVEIEFFGGDLQQGRCGALAEFDKTDEDGSGVVGVDGEPSIDLLGIGRTGNRAACGRVYDALRCKLIANEAGAAESDDQRAACFQKLATVEPGSRSWSDFIAPPPHLPLQSRLA